MAVHRQTRQRRKPVGEINVVPYIDVMLVLLIIFMITAPMLTQGVRVDLPDADANPVDMLDDDTEPFVVSVDAEGKFYATVGDKQDQPLDEQQLRIKTGAILRVNPNTPILVKGDQAASYGDVVYVMALLKRAGASSVGLITQQPEQNKNAETK